MRLDGTAASITQRKRRPGVTSSPCGVPAAAAGVDAAGADGLATFGATDGVAILVRSLPLSFCLCFCLPPFLIAVLLTGALAGAGAGAVAVTAVACSAAGAGCSAAAGAAASCGFSSFLAGNLTAGGAWKTR